MTLHKTTIQDMINHARKIDRFAINDIASIDVNPQSLFESHKFYDPKKTLSKHSEELAFRFRHEGITAQNITRAERLYNEILNLPKNVLYN